jgi:hypothetical protein
VELPRGQVGDETFDGADHQVQVAGFHLLR